MRFLLLTLMFGSVAVIGQIIEDRINAKIRKNKNYSAGERDEELEDRGRLAADARLIRITAPGHNDGCGPRQQSRKFKRHPGASKRRRR